MPRIQATKFPSSTASSSPHGKLTPSKQTTPLRRSTSSSPFLRQPSPSTQSSPTKAPERATPLQTRPPTTTPTLTPQPTQTEPPTPTPTLPPQRPSQPPHLTQPFPSSVTSGAGIKQPTTQQTSPPAMSLLTLSSSHPAIAPSPRGPRPSTPHSSPPSNSTATPTPKSSITAQGSPTSPNPSPRRQVHSNVASSPRTPRARFAIPDYPRPPKTPKQLSSTPQPSMVKYPHYTPLQRSLTS
mmetsp:Transcript_55797/g.167214  ORF Transcript_55797/g.167214 Transcript_55797/m.167214 type:complete len:240 (-) Transcript_55797:1425-2144(-)